MKELTFKQYLALAIVAGIFGLLSALISNSSARNKGAYPSGAYAVSNGDGNSNSTVTSININNSRSVSSSNNVSGIVNGDVIQSVSTDGR